MAFDYLAPTTIKEALSFLSSGDVSPLAGGTDLLTQIRTGSKQPKAVMDVKRIPDLMKVEKGSDVLSIGAGVPCYQIYENDKFAETFPVVVDAVSIIGGIQIQSRASLGGNLCNSSPSADGICPLMVLGARAVIARDGNERVVDVADFCTAPGKNVLEKGEMLLRIEIPLASASWGAAYRRFTPRNEMDIAVAGVAVAVKLKDGGTFEQARIALAGVAPTPVMAVEAQQSLAGKQVDDAVIEEAASLAVKSASPISDMRGTVEHRNQLVKVLVAAMIRKALERSK